MERKLKILSTVKKITGLLHSKSICIKIMSFEGTQTKVLNMSDIIFLSGMDVFQISNN